MGDFEWQPFVKQVSSAGDGVPPLSTIILMSSGRERGQARVDLHRAFEDDKDKVVEVTPDVLPDAILPPKGIG